MSIEIPAVKLSPELVFDILGIINQFNNNPEKMKEEIIKYYRQRSLHRKIPSEKNIIRAVTFPTLRHLDLVEGYWPNISLNPNGKIVLNAYLKHGLSGAKRKFGLIIYLVDERSGNIIKDILNLASKNNIVDFSLLLNSLSDKFKIKSEKENRILIDRLKRWINYLQYVGFIEQRGQTIKIYERTIQSCKKGETIKTPYSKFIDILQAKYKVLSKQEKSIYVPIPKLRDAVCEELGMLKDEFYDQLRLIKFTTDKYIIMLSEPMVRQKGGITIGDKYFYYITIYERGGSHL
jgi:hypothetical protein